MTLEESTALSIAKAICSHPDLRVGIYDKDGFYAAKPSDLVNVILTGGLSDLLAALKECRETLTKIQKVLKP